MTVAVQGMVVDVKVGPVVLLILSDNLVGVDFGFKENEVIHKICSIGVEVPSPVLAIPISGFRSSLKKERDC